MLYRAAGRLPFRRISAAIEGINGAVSHETVGQIIMRAMGDSHYARQVGEENSRKLHEVLGANHPYVIIAAIGVGNDLVLADEQDTARRLLADAWEDARRVLGERHPDTLVCGVNWVC